MVRRLVRAIRAGRDLHRAQAATWLFPAESRPGHLTEHKEDRRRLGKWGNDLRQTYRTLAQAAGLPELDIHLLMNHSISGVNGGYLNRSKLGSHPHASQQQLSAFILKAAGNPNWTRCNGGRQVRVGRRETKAD
jgi:lysophospholipase L1-like esterase